MKVHIVQPPYSKDYSKSEEIFNWEMKAFDDCPVGTDIILFPESCDVPCSYPNREAYFESVNKYCDKLMDKASKTAIRCNSNVIINLNAETDGKRRNTTCVFDRKGELIFKYFKQHLTPGEVNSVKLDSEYTFEYEPIYTFELEGLKFGFLICYDFYFYEMYPKMARENLDIIIGCSRQRTDTHATLETINKFCAYNCNAYLLRASCSMGLDSPVGGCSCVIAPDGKVLADMRSDVGSIDVEIDPTKKFYKPAGFGGDLMAHYQYIEKGRRPWKYRHGGSAIVRHDTVMPYPRTCSHRGFNSVAPENSMPAFGAAVALGAEEIEFDLWSTKDGVLVSAHDSTLERVSDGTGNIWDYTYDELLQFDFGIKKSERFKGLKICTFEEILKKFACHVIMNIHVKVWDNKFDDLMIEKIVGLIRQYDCEKYIYFMTSNDDALRKVKEYAPDLRRCVGHDDNRPWAIVDRAIELGAEKVQLYRPFFNKEMVDKAHANGIICNVFWSDDEKTAREYLDMGIDCILTNDYHQISQIVDEYKNK